MVNSQDNTVILPGSGALLTLGASSLNVQRDIDFQFGGYLAFVSGLIVFLPSLTYREGPPQRLPLCPLLGQLPGMSGYHRRR